MPFLLFRTGTPLSSLINPGQMQNSALSLGHLWFRHFCCECLCYISDHRLSHTSLELVNSSLLRIPTIFQSSNSKECHSNKMFSYLWWAFPSWTPPPPSYKVARRWIDQLIPTNCWSGLSLYWGLQFKFGALLKKAQVPLQWSNLMNCSNNYLPANLHLSNHLTLYLGLID